jgi:hypothetical protein
MTWKNEKGEQAMIDIGKILKRAWHILWNYKVLWIFGVLLALTAGGSGSGGNSGSGSGFRFNGPGNYNSSTLPGPFWASVNDWFQQNLSPLITHPDQHLATFIWIGVGLFLFFLILGSLAAILRYVSEAAVIRMVDDYEQNGTKLGFMQGWRLGWSRGAFRLWLIDLVISLPVIVFLLLAGLLGLGIFFSVKNVGGSALPVSLAAIGCLILFVMILIVLIVPLVLLRPFITRTAVLENVGVGESFRRGWHMVRSNLKSAALLWAVMIGLWIGSWLGTIILIVMLIPVFILTGITGLVVAVIPGLAAFGITSLFASGPLAWIIAALVALPFFLLVLASPLILVGGWVQVYTSSVWTLAYREIKTLAPLTRAEVPASAG